MHLRPYQSDITSEVRLWWELGHKVVCVQLSTGGGKTPVLADLINNHGGFVCAIAHRDRLVEQISLTLARAGIRHDLICSDKSKKLIAKKHVKALGQCFYVPGARCRVASIDTLVRAKGIDKWAAQVTLWVVDEAHHLLRSNKWGKGLGHFTHPGCHGLMLTATPGRPDKKGLGRHRKGCNGGPCEGCNDGLADALVIGPPMRWLIEQGYLCDYDVVCPPTDLVAAEAPRGSDGDLTRDQVREAERASHITGDIPSHYLEWAKGLSGVTFVGSIETATEVVRSFRDRGVPAELITGDTDPTVRDHIFEKAERGEILQIVAVDVISEGVDIPALQVGSFGRLTCSHIVWLQQCLDDKTQILTDRGWFGPDDVRVGDTVAAFDRTNGQVEWLPALSKTDRPLMAGEEMFGIRAPHLDIRVTGAHNMVVKSASTTAKNWVLEEASVMAERKGLSRIPVSGRLVVPEADIRDDELRLIGWFLSDGHIDKSNNVLSIAQSSAKTAHCAEIRRVFEACGLGVRETLVKRTGDLAHCLDARLFRVSHGTPRKERAHLKGWAHLAPWIDKNIPPIFDTLSERQFDILLGALFLGDSHNAPSVGWINHTKAITFGTNESMADRFQALALLRGYRANKSTEVAFTRGAVWYSVHFKKIETSTIAGTNTKDGAVSGKKPYSRSRFKQVPSEVGERVWCVENRLGTLFTRRNGKVAIVGNCGRLLRPLYAPGFDLDTQVGRLAAIAASKKPKALLIDHIGGFCNPALGPPDKPRVWSLEPGETRQATADPDDIPNRVCLNPDPLPSGRRCFAPYPRTMRRCPKCGWAPEPASRAAPEHVDGDLQLMDPGALNVLRGLTVTVGMDRAAHDAQQLAKGARPEWLGRHWRNYEATSEAQLALRDSMDRWAGRLHAAGRADYEIQRAFFLGFQCDVISAQGLSAADATALKLRIDGSVNGR